MAKIKATVLTDDDARTIRAIVKWWRSQKFEKALTVKEEERPPIKTDIFIAKVPSAELLSAFDKAEDKPGSLLCDIYQPSKNDGKEAPRRAGFQRLVLNYTQAEFKEETFVPVVRERFGKYIVAGGGGGGCPPDIVDDYDDENDTLVGTDGDDLDKCVRFSTPVCTTLRTLPDGDVETDTKFVAVTGDSCELVTQALDICNTFGTFTTEEHDEDVLLVGRDTVTETCHLYDVFSQIQALRDDICRLAAIVEQLVDAAAIGSNEICP